MITRCRQRSGRPASPVRAAVVVSVLLLATTPVPGCAIRPVGSSRDHAGQCGTPRNAATAQLKGMADDVEIAGPTRLWFPHPPATQLRDLISRVSATSCDHSLGKFDVVHYRRWWNSPDFAPALTDVIQWRADDRSGASLTTTYPRGPVEVSTDYWLPGENFRVRRGDPFADGKTRLQDLVLPSWDDVDLEDVLRSFAVLATWYSPLRAGRATVLAVLNDFPGFTLYSRVTDRAGRSGIGIAAADHDSRSLVVLHSKPARFSPTSAPPAPPPGGRSTTTGCTSPTPTRLAAGGNPTTRSTSGHRDHSHR